MVGARNHARPLLVTALIVAASALLAGPAIADATPSPTPTIAGTPTPSPSPTASPTASPSPSASPTPATPVFTSIPTPTISGSAKVAAKLTAKPGTWTPTATLTYQWRLDGAAVSGATASTWVVPATAIGKRVTVTVTGKRAGYVTASRTSTATAAVVPATLTTATPTISGTRTVGKTLTASAGTWGPSPVTLSYQWLRDGTAIAKATAKTYTLVSADADHKVSVRVTGKKTGYTTVAKTSTTVTIGRPLTTVKPKISGTIAVGKTVKAVSGTWGPSPVTLTYHWYRGSTKIAGATSTSYALAKADAGQKVSVRVTGKKTGYTTVTLASAAVSVPRVLTVPASVSVSGTPTVGTKLTASTGTWGPSPVTFSYQWLRDGKAISGAKAKTYTAVKADAAHKVSVKVTGAKSGYTTVSRTSATVAVKYPFTAAPTPTVSGSAKAGATLTAKVGTWSPSPTLKYQWRVDGSAVGGATKTTWVVPAWAAGRTVTFTVTATKSGYLTLTRTSATKTMSWSLGDRLLPGTAMRAGVYLSSPNGDYRFGLLGDGNVVLMKGATILRTARTTGTLSGTLVLQESGDLALFDESTALVWSTGTGYGTVEALTLDDDGLLALREIDGLTAWDSTALPVFDDPSAARGTTPGRYGWAYPILPSGTFTTYAGHSGDDIAAPTGTKAYAMRGGTVTYIGAQKIVSGCPSWAPNNTLQNDLEVTTVIDGTTVKLTYSHFSKFAAGLEKGDTVKAGQLIGYVGATGCATGPHLHVAITVGGIRYAMYPRDVLGTVAY